ncbi:MAG: SusD/RagB family nutrient-binding outer membrane lipoprotein [Lewinellaceae bacterium]|nr:SusD/RagB family nutrient-binding outer membrane lipoprotein [Lewinellaceae bacterium]
MKNIKIFISLLAFLLAANGCQKFDELEADPNRSTTVPPSLVLRGILKDLYYAPWSDEQRWNQYWCSNYNYYDNNEYWTGSAGLRFTTLKNVQKMEAEAARIGLPEVNAYSALGKFFRAYFYYDMTMKVGDLPLSQALQGVDNIAPAYDTQKDIFKQILVWLEESNTQLGSRISAADNTLEGDIYFDGDLRKWQKTVNAFKLRVLVQLSKKVAETDLGIQQEFAKTIGDPARYPLMEGNDDNLQFLFNSVNDKYPFNPDNFGFYADRYNTSATYVNTLAALQDPRVFVVAEPAAAKLAAGYTAQDFEAYVGAPSDEGLDQMATKVQAGEYSRINKARYFSSYDGEPSIQIGYSEMCFSIAEGINRGWSTGDAKSWYDKGITASMNFYGITDATAISAYLARPESAYKGNNADGLTQVLVQKYLALSQHSGFEGYYNWRRTAVPTFYEGGPGTGNSGVIPRRFQYPTNERDNNADNYNAALNRQFGNNDDSINDELWIVK